MASYDKCIKFEGEKPKGVIRLVEANGFYRAYNHSAYLFHQVIAQHKVTRKFVKNINQEIVYVGFPVDKLLERIGENKTRICDARKGVEFLGVFIKPFRTYVSSRSLRRIRNHLHAVTPRMRAQRAQAVVNSSLGVLSHYDSFCVRKVLVAKSRLTDFGLVSQDWLRFYPNALDWRLYKGGHCEPLNCTVAASATGAVTADPLDSACRGGRDSTFFCNCLKARNFKK